MGIFGESFFFFRCNKSSTVWRAYNHRRKRLSVLRRNQGDASSNSLNHQRQFLERAKKKEKVPGDSGGILFFLHHGLWSCFSKKRRGFHLGQTWEKITARQILFPGSPRIDQRRCEDRRKVNLEEKGEKRKSTESVTVLSFLREIESPKKVGDTAIFCAKLCPPFRSICRLSLFLLFMWRLRTHAGVTHSPPPYIPWASRLSSPTLLSRNFPISFISSSTSFPTPLVTLWHFGTIEPRKRATPSSSPSSPPSPCCHDLYLSPPFPPSFTSRRFPYST